MKISIKLHALLCSFGWHRWKYFELADSFKTSFPEMSHIGRRCDCGELNYLSDDRARWESGVNGVLVLKKA